MSVIFPNRVWEGGVSRPTTDEDYKRRRLIAELLDSMTTPERRQQINELLREAE